MPNGTSRVTRIVGLLLTLFCVQQAAVAQKFQANYDESKVPKFDLPDPLKMESGKAVTSAKQWREERRPELMDLFATHVYGRTPDKPVEVSARVVSEGEALGGAATRREIELTLPGKTDGPIRILLFVPAKASGAVPAFIGLNFNGNHTLTDDPAIPISTQWMRNGKGNVNNRATEETRGKSASRWPVARILERGYALATVYYGDIDPDFDDGFQNGIHPAFHQGGTKPAADEWGSIGAWSWGLSRALDYLEEDKDVDGKRVVLLGHSRLGKTALWGGAQDERFAAVISNNSGCGGAALSRRRFGETVGRINTSFPHWFCDNFQKYNLNEDDLPVDSHQLVALIAPRPVLICSAEEDRWADPRGEFLSALGADSVYRLLGTDGIAGRNMPSPDPHEVMLSTIGYRIRPGKHDVTGDDWEAYMDFADHHLKK